ncbi:MAG: TetR/AcrR family transcriptional regulator [Anaerolineae bacterium]|nr:TetR/AcrR family transcriptional regulator [Anaerolineae bacterium]
MTSIDERVVLRQRALETGLRLMAERGYAAVTVEQIAAAADLPVETFQQLFPGKESLVMALYQQLAAETLSRCETLPPGTVAARFHHVMRAELDQFAPHREPLAGLFGAAMSPHVELGILGTHGTSAHDPMRQVFTAVVTGASDPPKDQQVRQIATLLYAAYLAVVLFWLYDRTSGSRASAYLLDFMRDGLGLARGAMILPPVANTIARLASVFEAVFGKSPNSDDLSP